MTAIPGTSIYLDYAATTPLAPEVAQAMAEYASSSFGNPSSLHHRGRAAREAVDRGREIMADALGARPTEIIFTSGGTEADNLAIMGMARGMSDRGRHIVTTAIEHHAVLESCHALEKAGFEVTYVGVGKDGIVDPDDVARALRDDTVLASVMYANNEVGTIQPIVDIAHITRDRGVYLHCDAVPALPWERLDVEELGVDLLTVTAHKAYGPIGVGALYVREGTRMAPLTYGGAQEGGRRAGTENVGGIVGFGRAVELVAEHRERDAARVRGLRDRFVEKVRAAAGDVHVNGDADHRLPNIANLCFTAAEAEPLLLSLDLAGICASAGSACASGAVEASHVLTALGLSREDAASSLRFSLGRLTTEDGIDRVLEILPGLVAKMREIGRVGA
jgi:cysteine desulfurase